MPSYRYSALDQNQCREQGNLYASNKAELAQLLLSRNLTLLSARRQLMQLHTKLSLQQLANLCGNLQQLLMAGVPILRALQYLSDNSKGLERALLTDIIMQINAGSGIAAAFAQHRQCFGEVMIGMLQLGEQSGTLDKILEQLTIDFEWQLQQRNQLHDKLSYPLMALVVVLAVSAFMLIFLVPQLQQFLQQSGVEMPVYTKALLWLSEFISAYGVYLLVLLALLCICVYALAQNVAKVQFTLHTWLLKLPLLGEVIYKFKIARMSQQLALTYKSGINIISSLQLATATLNNRALQQALQRALVSIESGSSLSASFAEQKLFSTLLLLMLEVGEQSGRLDLSLQKISAYYRRDAEHSVQLLHNMLNPMLTIFLGLILLWIMAATVLPIYDAGSLLGALS